MRACAAAALSGACAKELASEPIDNLLAKAEAPRLKLLTAVAVAVCKLPRRVLPREVMVLPAVARWLLLLDCQWQR